MCHVLVCICMFQCVAVRSIFCLLAILQFDLFYLVLLINIWVKWKSSDCLQLLNFALLFGGETGKEMYVKRKK